MWVLGGEPLFTLLALVGPLTSVGPLVLSKVTSLSEPLFTLLALVGPLTSVGPLVLSKVTSQSEPLFTLLALVGPLTSVGLSPVWVLCKASTVAGTSSHVEVLSPKYTRTHVEAT